MKVRLVDRTPIIKEIEIPDHFEPIFAEDYDDDFTVEKWKAWKNFRKYLDTDPEISAVHTGALETIDGKLLAEWVH